MKILVTETPACDVYCLFYDEAMSFCALKQARCTITGFDYKDKVCEFLEEFTPSYK